jgi:uncharacterized alkaline shock family protein YloU
MAPNIRIEEIVDVYKCAKYGFKIPATVHVVKKKVVFMCQNVKKMVKKKVVKLGLGLTNSIWLDTQALHVQKVKVKCPIDSP